jgi:hypothetical protein
MCEITPAYMLAAKSGLREFDGNSASREPGSAKNYTISPAPRSIKLNT